MLVSNQLLMCPAHWNVVDKQTRSEVWRWYRAMNANKEQFNINQYDKARTAAIDQVNKAEAANADAGRQQMLL